MFVVEKEKSDLIKRLIHSGVLAFEEKTLKSGRVSPYFFNIGNTSALALHELSKKYAQLLNKDIDLVFGSAYKGISLASSVAVEFAKMNGRDAYFLSDRKEMKTHGDASDYVGVLPKDDFLVSIVDDVITDGTTKYEAVEFLKRKAKVRFSELVIAFNRQEVDKEGNDAVAGFKIRTNIDVKSVLTLNDAFDYLVEQNKTREVDSVIKYVGQYGTREARAHILSAA